MAATKKSAPKPRKRALAPQTQPRDPERQHIYILPPAATSGVRVNEDTALTLGAVWACVRVITESLAGLPWLVYRRRADGGRDLVANHPMNWLLDIQPNPEMTAFTFRETMIAHVMLWGNGYAEIERSIGGVTWLWPITPDRVKVHRYQGEIVYEVQNETGGPTFLFAEDMLHVRGLGFDGLVGYSVIKMAARTIGLGIALDEASGGLFENDSTPGGVILHPAKLSTEALNNLRTSWERRHKGPANRRRVAILEEGMKWEQTGLPPEDAQLVQQRQLTPPEICRWFRVPPHKIGDLSRATFSNIEHQSIEFVEDTLRPWAERLESEVNIKCFGRNNTGTLETIIDLEERKRGDTAARTAYYMAMFDRGAFSINDIRMRENMNPIGPDGDKRFVPLNMVLLEKAGEEEVAPPEPTEPQPDDEPENDAPSMDEEDDTLSEFRASALAVVEDACRRLLNRETKDCQKLTGDALVKWMEQHREYGRKALAPGVRTLAACYGVKSEQARSVALEAFLVSYIQGTEGPQEPEAMAIRLVECLKAAKGAA